MTVAPHGAVPVEQRDVDANEPLLWKARLDIVRRETAPLNAKAIERPVPSKAQVFGR